MYGGCLLCLLCPLLIKLNHYPTDRIASVGIKSVIFVVARKLSQVTGELSRVPGGFSQVDRGYIFAGGQEYQKTN